MRPGKFPRDASGSPENQCQAGRPTRRSDLEKGGTMTSKKRTTVVVNMFGGPGAGKTTAAWRVASRLSELGYLAEYVPEVAKERTWRKDSEALSPLQRARAAEDLDGRPDHQLGIFREQAERVNVLEGQVDFIVTDSPTLLGLLYMTDDPKPGPIHDLYEKVSAEIRKEFGSHENFNMLVKRGPERYRQEGRNQDRQQALELDRKLVGLLGREGVFYGSYVHGKGIDQAIENMQKTLRRVRGQARRRDRDECNASRDDGRDAGEASGVRDGETRRDAGASEGDRGGWEPTDEDTSQWCRSLGEGTFEFAQSMRLADGRWAVARGVVDLTDVDDAELDGVCRSYYEGGAAEVRRTYGDDAPQVLAECWFESTVASEDVEIHDSGFDPRPWAADEGRDTDEEEREVPDEAGHETAEIAYEDVPF